MKHEEREALRQRREVERMKRRLSVGPKVEVQGRRVMTASGAELPEHSVRNRIALLRRQIEAEEKIVETQRIVIRELQDELKALEKTVQGNQ